MPIDDLVNSRGVAMCYVENFRSLMLYSSSSFCHCLCIPCSTCIRHYPLFQVESTNKLTTILTENVSEFFSVSDSERATWTGGLGCQLHSD